MIFNNCMIESFAYHVPDQKITSDEIEERLDPLYKRLKLPKGRLELMSGIKERRFWNNGVPPSQLSSTAASNLLNKSSLDTDQIDILIHSSVCRDFLEPATASVIHNNLKLSSKCMILDVSNACLGFINSLIIVANMIEHGAIKCGLVVSGENSGPLLEETFQHLLTDPNINRKNIKQYFANLTIGSGAVAFLLCHKDLAPNGHKILGGVCRTKSDVNHLCQGHGNVDSLMMQTDSEGLLLNGIVLSKETWAATKEALKWNNDTPDWVIGHQVGTAHEELVLNALDLKHKKTYKTYPYWGNTGSAALPITLTKMATENQIKKGEKIAMLGIGSGLSSIMLGVEW